MKIFLDTNIFLDLALGRKYSKEALMILNAVEKGYFQGFILDITLLNIDYVAKKQVKDIRGFLKLINDTFVVLGATNDTVKQALDIQNNDLEDALQYASAQNNSCDIIISNDKKFYAKSIPILSSIEFIDRLQTNSFK